MQHEMHDEMQPETVLLIHMIIINRLFTILHQRFIVINKLPLCTNYNIYNAWTDKNIKYAKRASHRTIISIYQRLVQIVANRCSIVSVPRKY